MTPEIKKQTDATLKLSTEEHERLVVLIAAFDKADEDAKTYPLSGKADGFDLAKEIVTILKMKMETQLSISY